MIVQLNIYEESVDKNPWAKKCGQWPHIRTLFELYICDHWWVARFHLIILPNYALLYFQRKLLIRIYRNNFDNAIYSQYHTYQINSIIIIFAVVIEETNEPNEYFVTCTSHLNGMPTQFYWKVKYALNNWRQYLVFCQSNAGREENRL